MFAAWFFFSSYFFYVCKCASCFVVFFLFSFIQFCFLFAATKLLSKSIVYSIDSCYFFFASFNACHIYSVDVLPFVFSNMIFMQSKTTTIFEYISLWLCTWISLFAMQIFARNASNEPVYWNGKRLRFHCTLDNTIIVCVCVCINVREYNKVKQKQKMHDDNEIISASASCIILNIGCLLEYRTKE